MDKQSVIFLASTEYDNLGVGYLAATLKTGGIESKTIDFRRRKSYILKTIKTVNPVIIGFSVIFLNYLNHFIVLARFLRVNGIKCHFTAGGHYASLKYRELFEKIPELDSIVRFEGEYTLYELVQSINSGKDWSAIEGIAYKKNGEFVSNPLRPVEKDLDKFPYPSRLKPREFAFNKRFTTLIAGRGCNHNCSFCTTPEFYRKSSGPVKRIRTPESVADEIEFLYRKYSYLVFIFQDDDFPVKSGNKQGWIGQFCSALERKGLSGKIMWKINCRTDEINEEILLLMKKHGLFQVFIGIEDGTETGLKKFNKNITPEDNLACINLLKKLKIGFDYGFMLFHPYTVYKTFYENLNFLKLICGDGYTPVKFLKLLPLYETPIEKELIKAGRLKYIDGMQDYYFPEESMNHYYEFITNSFHKWMHHRDGVENISKWARNYISVYLRYFDHQPEVLKLFRKIKSVIANSNLFMLDNLKELAYIFESDEYLTNKDKLDRYCENISINHNFFKNQIIQTMGKVLDLASV